MNYHAHLYFSDKTFGRAPELRSELTKRFGEQVRLFRLHDKAIGPHPVPSFGVAFTSPIVDDIRTWLKGLAPEISSLLHPITADDLEAHSQYAEWYGTPQDLRMKSLSARANPTRDGLKLTLSDAEFGDYLDIDGFIIEEEASSQPIGSVGLGTYYPDLSSHNSVLETCGIYALSVPDPEKEGQALELCLDYLERFTDAKDALVHISENDAKRLSLFETAGFQRLGNTDNGSTIILGLSFRER